MGQIEEMLEVMNEKGQNGEALAVGAVLFPSWNLQRSKKGSCQLLKAGIGKNVYLHGREGI
jgi:hypothetical protein